MARMKREPCPVCNRPVALNWRSREMAHHLEGFPRLRDALVATLSKFNLDSLGGSKYERAGQEIMHHAASLNRLIRGPNAKRRRAP